jgi:uncharacterized protein YndB with AHSA1/START domain
MKASAEIVIERPREAVWRWASDPANWDRWEDDLSGISATDYEIIETIRPRRQVVRSVTGGSRFESTLELVEDVGGTRVCRTVDAGPGEDALTRIAFVAARPLARRDMRRRIEAQLARLKEMVELEATL